MCSKRGPGKNWRALPPGGPSPGIGGNRKILFLVKVQQKGARKKLARATAWGALPLELVETGKSCFWLRCSKRGPEKIGESYRLGGPPLELVDESRKSCFWLRCSKRGTGKNWRELPPGGPSPWNWWKPEKPVFD